jgi:NTP pyrophosphatase (non-canonical NTP hydrolase)
MTGNEYQQAALRTASEKDMLINGALGLCGESGEFADMVKKHKFQGHDLDREKAAKELGDICWYIAVSAESIGYDMDDIMQMNIDKLMKRYPDGFRASDSINRED